MDRSFFVSLFVSLLALAGVLFSSLVSLGGVLFATLWREGKEDTRREQEREAERKAREDERELERERRWLERKLAAYTEYLTRVNSLERSCGDIREGRLAVRADGPSETLEALFSSTEELGLLVPPNIHQKLETLTFVCANLLFHSRTLAEADLDRVDLTERKAILEVINKAKDALQRERKEFMQLAGRDLGRQASQTAPEGS
ncbi:hypothetical protein [Saccharopolyspora sp. NPDC049426]|uniref:hypothetical protein n=1 Tax=Saccharopolyspora sp. NPDC049426 TaxID=3155652 RepID=UPI00342C6D54